MILNLREQERAMLADLLEITLRRKLHELHHTSTRAYKEQVRHEIEAIEALETKLNGPTLSGAFH